MAESVLTLCPNCGRRLKVAEYQEMVTCTSCKQVSKIQYPWGVHQPKKQEPPRQMIMQPVLPEKRDNRVLWLVVAGLVLATAAALTFGVILPRINAANQPPPPTDYFVDATTIPDELVRALGFPAMVQRLTIYSDRAEVEAWKSEENVVKRYLVKPTGTTERRGGRGERTAAFDASELEFSRVPRMVAGALTLIKPENGPAQPQAERVFATPDPSAEPPPEKPSVHNLVVERSEDGAVRWRVSVRSKEGVYHVDYDAKGNRLETKPK
ncbi:MAG TPA: hypothetical protein VNM90_18435 [Haliangium sp.]|nr:hypothetical protein [Haliangium sp.]